MCLSIDVTGALVLFFHLYCTSFPLSLSLVFFLIAFSVLVCLSIDVTGALVLFVSCLVRVPISLLLSVWVFIPVLVCLSIDVTGALVLFTHLCTDTSGLPFAAVFVFLSLFLWLWVVVFCCFGFADVAGALASFFGPFLAS